MFVRVYTYQTYFVSETVRTMDANYYYITFETQKETVGNSRAFHFINITLYTHIHTYVLTGIILFYDMFSIRVCSYVRRFVAILRAATACTRDTLLCIGIILRTHYKKAETYNIIARRSATAPVENPPRRPVDVHRTGGSCAPRYPLHPTVAPTARVLVG